MDGREQALSERGVAVWIASVTLLQNQNRDPREWKAHFLEAVDDAFKTMDVDMAEEHARAQMRAQMNIGDEALIGRWSWDDIQVELLTWDEDGDFGDAWARIPFAFWARYHQYILNSNRANRRATWRAGVSSGTNGGASTSILDGPSTSSTIRTRNAARTSANFFSWIQYDFQWLHETPREGVGRVCEKSSQGQAWVQGWGGTKSCQRHLFCSSCPSPSHVY